MMQVASPKYKSSASKKSEHKSKSRRCQNFLLAPSLFVFVVFQNLQAPDLALDEQKMKNSMSLLSPQQITCHWTVLAGDSNTRGVFRYWEQVLQEQNFTVVNLHRLGKLPPKPDIDDWEIQKNMLDCFYRRSTQQDTFEHYTDHELLAKRNGKCFIMSQKFLLSQDAIGRLVTNMSSTKFCGTHLDRLPKAFVRPAQPDAIWFSHGFWTLPGQGGSTIEGMDCSTRFTEVVEGLKAWQAAKIPFKWQTLFRINHHWQIKNKYLEWDHECHLKTAAQHNLPIFDLYPHINPSEDIFWQDYHYTTETQSKLLKTILRFVFGGQNAFFGTRVIAGTSYPYPTD